MCCFEMFLVHLFVQRDLAAQLTNHMPCSVSIFNVFGEECFEYIFLTMWTFGAFVSQFNVLIKQLLRIKAVHTFGIFTLECLHFVRFLDVSI